MGSRKNAVLLTICFMTLSVFSAGCQSSGSSASGTASAETIISTEAGTVSAETIISTETDTAYDIQPVNESQQSQNAESNLEVVANLYAYTNDKNMNNIINLSYTFTDINNLPNALDESKILFKGNDTVITKAEVDVYEKYYSALGTDDPHQRAVEAVEERHALYAAAIKSGYAVTDDDVNAYLEEIKSGLKEALGDKDFAKLIASFGSEDKYWAYESGIYKIDLPINNYRSAKEKSYEETGTGQNDNDEQWNAEFKKLKDKLVEEQNYQQTNS